jgi:hypothetical protein
MSDFKSGHIVFYSLHKDCNAEIKIWKMENFEKQSS